MSLRPAAWLRPDFMPTTIISTHPPNFTARSLRHVITTTGCERCGTFATRGLQFAVEESSEWGNLMRIALDCFISLRRLNPIRKVYQLMFWSGLRALH